MLKATLSITMQNQFANVWQMLQEAVENCPDDHWRSGDDHFLVPARLVFHAVQAVDYYFDAEPDRYDWQHFGFDWAEAEPEALIAKKDLQAYLARIKVKTETWFQSLGDEGLTGPDQMPQFFSGPTLARAIYALRHVQYHLGQLDAEMHRRGLKSAEWR